MRRRLPLILGLAAGIVVGVALFDLLPESFELGAAHYGPQSLFAAAAIGMMSYMVLDRGLAGMPPGLAGAHRHLGPAGLTLHSLTDGLGIGITFRLSSAAGFAMAIAVLIHDLVDGMNTVTISLSKSNSTVAHRWLVANSMAPVIGVIAGIWVNIDDLTLSLLLALLGGAFLYIGACQLIPQRLAVNGSPSAPVAIAVGMAFIYAVLSLARQ